MFDKGAADWLPKDSCKVFMTDRWGVHWRTRNYLIWYYWTRFRQLRSGGELRKVKR